MRPPCVAHRSRLRSHSSRSRAAGGGSAAAPPRGSGNLVEVVVTLPRLRLPSRSRTTGHSRRRKATPLARRERARSRLLPAHPGRRSADAGRPARGLDPRGPRQLALRSCARRRLRRPSRLGSRAPARDPGRDRLAERHVPRARDARLDVGGHGGSGPGSDRRDRALGLEPRHRRPGHQDRARRRRHRPGTPLLQPVRLLVSRRLPEGEHRLHHAQGHRRARLPLALDELEVRRRPFDPIYSFHATHVAGIAAGDHDTPTAPTTARPSRASRRRHTSATTRR